MLRAVVGTHSPFCWGAARKSVSGGAADQISPLDQGSHQVSKCPWLCENSGRAFTEGNRVLPAPRFPSRLLLLARTLGWKRKSFCAFFAPQRFDTAKTHSCPSRHELAASHDLWCGHSLG